MCKNLTLLEGWGNMPTSGSLTARVAPVAILRRRIGMCGVGLPSLQSFLLRGRLADYPVSVGRPCFKELIRITKLFNEKEKHALQD